MFDDRSKVDVKAGIGNEATAHGTFAVRICSNIGHWLYCGHASHVIQADNCLWIFVIRKFCKYFVE